MYLPEKGYKRLFTVILYLILGAVAVFIAWKYLLIVLIPFGISWILAYFLQKPIEFLKKKCKIPKNLSAIVLILLVISIVSGLLFLVFDKLFDELYYFYEYAKANGDELAASVTSTLDSFEKAVEKLPFSKFFDTEKLSENIRTVASDGLMNLLTGAVEKIPSFLTSVVSLLPNLLIFIIILIFSSFYLTSDFTHVNQFFLAQFNEKTTHFLVEFKTIFFDVISKFIKAYILLFFITFAVMLVALALIGIKFAFIVALSIAIVDLLPILGCGTVLIPWSIVSIITGNYSLAIELIILYIAITFIRQMLQPRIIGDFIGLHPLASLLSMFLGYAVMGIAGMFIFPIVLIILKTMNDRGTIHLWKRVEAPPKPKKKKS